MYGNLARDIYFSGMFEDGKVFVDALPKRPISDIIRAYEAIKNNDDFNLKSFVYENFEFFKPAEARLISPRGTPIEDHIQKLWHILQRPADEIDTGTKLPLPYPYIVPGGRFNEIYYWDSYFTLLGIIDTEHSYLIEAMVKNFAYMLNTYGKIPNGNRTYYLGRSQPPFFAQMVKILVKTKGQSQLTTYLPQLQQEYDFWMRDKFVMDANIECWKRLVKTDSGAILNKYYNERKGPREEMYLFDYSIAQHSTRPDDEIYNNFRASCESGWVFSSRWLKDPADLSSIRTTDFAAVDLNSLLYGLEDTLEQGYQQIGSTDLAHFYHRVKCKRKGAIMQYFWNEKEGYFFDYNFKERKLSDRWTLAGIFPLYENLVTQKVADRVLENIHDKFLNKGGLTTTLEMSRQIWDYPYGCAPLNWVAAIAAYNYKNYYLADEICKRFMLSVDIIFKKEHKITDKYNMVDPQSTEDTGQYLSQDGFGYTNGVYMAMKAMRTQISQHGQRAQF